MRLGRWDNVRGSIGLSRAAEGYAVILHPRADQLPPFAKDFGVGLVATRSEERVLVQVKWDRADLEADPNVPLQAGITNTQPGWHYDLVVLNEGDAFRRLTRDAREPSEEEIGESLAHADRLLQAGDLRAACGSPGQPWKQRCGGWRVMPSDIGRTGPPLSCSGGCTATVSCPEKSSIN
jgi:hypothetical protein